MIFVGGSGEKWAAGIHFSHDAAGGPDVDRGVVGARAEKDVRGTVPEGDDFVGEGVDRDAKGSCETKVGQFELTFVVDEEVLGFQISMEDAVLVAESNALKELVHEGFDRDVVQLPATAAGVHVFLEVFVHVFENEHELVLGVDDVVERHNVFMFQFFHEGDLAYGGGRGTFFGVEVDFFEGDEFPGLAIAAFEHLWVAKSVGV